ncbi:hypothetical protein [Rhizobium leguminosarum]|uniref:hypothetical protein n=1 Tax=Rhizobium leguminosarum TaxID=384 RepID=UPI00041524C3|nr:hypothetical protein [Rhizobium leguminosarum]
MPSHSTVGSEQTPGSEAAEQLHAEAENGESATFPCGRCSVVQIIDNSKIEVSERDGRQKQKTISHGPLRGRG